MASDRVTRERDFVIGKDPDTDWAIYTQHEDFAVKPGASVEQIAKSVAMRRSKLRPLDPPADPSRPERYLDIVETAGGVCRYTFHLETDRLRFVRTRPFLPFPLNAKSQETFLDRNDFLVAAAGAWASFVCDLTKVRHSTLARHIRSLNRTPAGHGPMHSHRDLLNIPFTFNVIDPLFEAAPWVVPGHALSPGAGRKSAAAHYDDGRTHGGVHPTTVAFLSVDVTDA
jgi:hypothetical protein